MKSLRLNTRQVKATMGGLMTEIRVPIKKEITQFLSGKPQTWVANGSRRTKELIPPYQPGDILYVRETWTPFCINKNTCRNALISHADYCYKASPEECVDSLGCKWHPSVHMPKEAARLFLRVVEVRVERLRSISDMGCWAEGLDSEDPHYCEAEHYHLGGVRIAEGSCERHAFSYMWDETYYEKGLGWDTNPWVWVRKFEVVKDAHQQTTTTPVGE